MKKIISIVLFFLFSKFSLGQAVTNTSYVNQSGEKILRLEVILPLTVDKVWALCSTDDGIRKWMAPLAHIELKAGGQIVTNYDVRKSLDDSSSIHLPIVNFIDKELMTLKVNLNGSFSTAVRETDDNLFEIIQFRKVDQGHTAIISSMVGFGSGAEWEKTYAFFEKGNAWTFEELVKAVKVN